MEKIIDSIIVATFAVATAYGGHYALKSMYEWSRYHALEKAAQGLGSLEKASQIMTGGKLDF
jgi:hypothetical protein